MANQLLHEKKGNGKTFVLSYQDDMRIKMFRQERGRDCKFYNTDEKIVTGAELECIFKNMNISILAYNENRKNNKRLYKQKKNIFKLSISSDERRSCWKALEHSGIDKNAYTSLEDPWLNGDISLVSASDNKRYAYSKLGLFHSMVRVGDGMVFDDPVEILALNDKENKMIFPSTSISIYKRNSYGYKKDDLLPIDENNAVSLFHHSYTIYKLYPDNTHKQIVEIKEIYEHRGIFGIEKALWNKINNPKNKLI